MDRPSGGRVITASSDPIMSTSPRTNGMSSLIGYVAKLLLVWLALFLLLASAVCFGFYVGTGQAFYKRLGLVILKWTTIAAVVFFVVVLFERLL